jgi:hypothetical protein
MTSIAQRLCSSLGLSSFGQSIGRAIHQPLVNVIPRRRVNPLIAVLLLLVFLILVVNKLNH